MTVVKNLNESDFLCCKLPYTPILAVPQQGLKHLNNNKQ